MKSPNTKDIQTAHAGESEKGEDYFFPKTKHGQPVTIKAKSASDAEKKLAELEVNNKE